MSQGGDHAASHIANVEHPCAEFTAAAVFPPAHIALPRSAPVFTVAAEDFYQEDIKVKAQQRLQYIRLAALHSPRTTRRLDWTMSPQSRHPTFLKDLAPILDELESVLAQRGGQGGQRGGNRGRGRDDDTI